MLLRIISKRLTDKKKNRKEGISIMVTVRNQLPFSGNFVQSLFFPDFFIIYYNNVNFPCFKVQRFNFMCKISAYCYIRFSSGLL